MTPSVSYARAGSPVRYAKFQSIRYFIDIDILQILLVDIDIDIDIYQKCRYIENQYFLSIYWPGIAVRYAKFQSIRYFIDIDILQNLLIDIDIFQKGRYIDNRYFLSIYRTGLRAGQAGETTGSRNLHVPSSAPR